jgi:hypothetical protein
MNYLFALAGCLALVVGLAHSVLGELLLLRRLSEDSFPALAGSKAFARRTMRLTWHLPTVFGWGFAAILLRLSLPSSPGSHLAFVEGAAAFSFVAAALVALFVSRGKHPGWVGLLGVAILIFAALARQGLAP